MENKIIKETISTLHLKIPVKVVETKENYEIQIPILPKKDFEVGISIN